MTNEGSGGERSGNLSRLAFLYSPDFFQRVPLLICAIAISASVIYKSRSGRENPAEAAFSVSSSSRGFVRISGDVRHAGMYPISANKMTIAAIKMADPLSSTINGLSEVDAAANLENGMALHVTVRPNGTLLLMRSQMSVDERLVMGVPLDLNSMSEADFDRVPGIGPKMAKRIVEYRQNNGGSIRVTDLLSIEGIADKKYKHLLKYF